MNTSAELKTRATIIKLPDTTPGVLSVNGEQIPFRIEQMWKSATAPAINMVVEIEFDPSRSITAIRAVDAQQLAQEKFEHLSGVAQARGKDAAGLASRGAGALAAGMGKSTLIAAVALWIAWFWLPALSFDTQMFQKSLTFWQLLGIDIQDLLLQSHGLFSLIGLAAIMAPFAAPFVRHSRARTLYAAPLVYLILALLEIRSKISGIVGDLKEVQAEHLLSVGFGAYVLLLASLLLAAKAVLPSNAKTIALAATSFLALISLAACSGRPADSLIGTYAGKHLRNDPYIRVERSGSDYFLRYVRNGLAGERVPAHPVDQDQLQKSLHPQPETPVVGLEASGVALLKVPVGWRAGNFKSSTGYVLFEGGYRSEVVKAQE